MERRIADPQTLGAAVREARAARDWTQAELASRAGVSRSFVLDIERGSRPRAELVRVLSVLKALGKFISLVEDEQPDSFDDVLDKVLG
jgi:HTH-type transcriptional regulator / antitoxin HipB